MARSGLRAVAFLALAALPATPAGAWGDDGHKIVCQIATQLLRQEEQKKVKALVRAFVRPDGERYAHLATACVFADTARSRARAHESAVRHGRAAGAERLAPWARFGALDRWHFVNGPRSSRRFAAEDCRDCVLEAIARDRRRLADPRRSSAERGEALILLGHWVADVHQPLHVGYADDRGGSEVDRMTGVYGEAEDLHAVWDSGILSRARGARDWRAYASELGASIEPGERARWEGADVPAWAGESYAIATEAQTLYCRWEGGECRSLGRARKLDLSYQARFQPVVETRLQQAAVRLARMISQALAGTP